MRGIRKFIAVAILYVLISGLSGSPVLAQSTDTEQYFPETNQTVRGAFLTFYRDAPDPLLLFGYPITGEVTDPASGRVVQYFQRARFELVGGDKIELAPLGESLYEEGAPPAPLSTSSPACRSFASGHSVCYSFLRFYDAYKGEVYFGDPISEVEFVDGRYVQYFQRARFEWRPDVEEGEVVGLADLGRIDYNLNGGKMQQIANPGSELPQALLSLRANAFVAQPLIASNSTQALYVIVQDQKFQPVEGAMVTISVYYPDGSQYDVRAPATSADGISEYHFQIGQMPLKEVVRVEASIDYSGTATRAATWFRIWW